MAIDYDALAASNKKIKEGSGESSDLFLKQKEITDATPVRLMPNSPKMSGMPYYRVKTWWFDNKTPVISFATYGKPDPIQEEIDEAMNSDDADIVALATNEDRIKVNESYWFPVLHLEYVMEGRKLKGIRVIGKRPKLLQAGPQLASNINDIIGSRVVQDIDSEDGMADRELGYNMILTREKTGTKARDVKYKAVLDKQWEVKNTSYYLDLLDPFEVAKSLTPGKAYQRALIRELLYGEEIPKEIEEQEAARVESYKQAYKEKMAELEAASKKAGSGTSKVKDEPDPEEEDKPAKKSAKPKAEDLDDDLPFEEDDKPAPKKSSKKVEDDVDMEEDDKPVAKKTAPKKDAVATKAVAKKKITDDLEDEFD